MSAAAESVFVSHAGPDQAWAEWVAWQLREAGHQVELDVWNWRTGDNFVTRMSEALERATAVVALFSHQYFVPTRWTQAEWTSAMASRSRLVPLTIEPVASADIPDILRALVRKNLHGLDEQSARAALLDAVSGPTGPLTAPGFPGGGPAPVRPSPAGSSSQSPRLPSSAGVVPPVWNVEPRNPHFTGREPQLGRIREGLLGDRRAVALHGLGGIGKTQIALEYAHRFASQYDTVWWIDAEQADQILVRYVELAARLDIAKPDAGAEHNVRMLLDHLRTQDRWLIILDNAVDPEDFETPIPTGPGHVLITSRNPDWQDRVHGLDLDVFARSDSLAYLTARIPGIAAEQADGLADDLGDLPLALAQAAGVISSGMTVDRYRLLLTDKTAKLMENGGPHGYPAPLAAAVDIATTRLAADQPDAADLLSLGAFFGPEPIPIAWLEAIGDQLATVAVDPDDFMWPQRALQSMAHYGLARLGHETVQIHRLTQAILRDRSSAADTAAAEDDVTAILGVVTPGDPDTPTDWPRWAALTAHLTARRQSAAHRPALRQALIQAARYLVRSGQPRAALDLAANLHRTWTDTLDDSHEDTLKSAQFLGHALIDLGEFAEARPVVEDTLERRRAILGEDHPDTLQSANDLSVIMDGLGEFAVGRRMHEDILEHRRAVLGEDHPDTLRSAHNLAATMFSFGDYAQARRMHEDTLERRRAVLGEDHPDTLHSAHNLASTLFGLKEFAEAREMDEDILERRRAVLGEDHPDTLRSAHSLAITLRSTGEHATAVDLLKDTRARIRRTLGDDHPLTETVTKSLARALTAAGKPFEAHKLLAARKPGQRQTRRKRR